MFIELSALQAKLCREGSLVLDVKVIPRASVMAIVGVEPDGTLKLKVNAAPERGKANDQVCRLLASEFDVPVRNVQVLAGETSQRKRVRISR